MKKGNPHRKAETKAMKETGQTSRVEFRRKKAKAKKDIKRFEESMGQIKDFLNENVADLLEINNIEHFCFEENTKDGIFTINHYIIATQEQVNIIQASFNILMRYKQFDTGGLFEIKFYPAEVN